LSTPASSGAESKGVGPQEPTRRPKTASSNVHARAESALSAAFLMSRLSELRPRTPLRSGYVVLLDLLAGDVGHQVHELIDCHQLVRTDINRPRKNRSARAAPSLRCTPRYRARSGSARHHPIPRSRRRCGPAQPCGFLATARPSPLRLGDFCRPKFRR